VYIEKRKLYNEKKKENTIILWIQMKEIVNVQLSKGRWTSEGSGSTNVAYGMV